MKIFYSLIIFFNFLLVSPLNLRNKTLIDELYSNSEGYKKLIQEANQTFYQLYDITLDFKERYYLEIDDDTKFLRVIINENKTKESENVDTFEFKNFQITSDFEIPENISITIFRRTFNLKEEFFILSMQFSVIQMLK